MLNLAANLSQLYSIGICDAQWLNLGNSGQRLFKFAFFKRQLFDKMVVLTQECIFIGRCTYNFYQDTK